MKLNKILRGIWRFLYWFILGYLISLCVLEKNTIITNIALVAYGINMLVHIVKYICERSESCKNYKNMKVLFYYLRESHKARYSCLIQGNTKGAQEFEEIIKMSSDAILQVGPSVASYKELTKKELKEVQEIVDKTKVLLTTIQPPV